MMSIYIPEVNVMAMKGSISNIIREDNISVSKVAKSLNIDTSEFKKLKDINSKKEFTPGQYLELKEVLKKEINFGKEPDNFYDKLLIILYKRGLTVDEFCERIKINKKKLISLFNNEMGVSCKYKETFCKVISEEEFESLNRYKPIILSSERDETLIKKLNAATLINVFMVKRGLTIEKMAEIMGYTKPAIQSILNGCVIGSTIPKAAEALNLPEGNFERIILNSFDKNNDFGYFLQKEIFETKSNIYSFSSKIGMQYNDLKDIVCGKRMMTKEELMNISEKLSLDPEQVKETMSMSIKEDDGDDKFIPYNFLKWANEHPEETYAILTEKLGINAANVIKNIKRDVKVNLNIYNFMAATGLSKEELRKKLSKEEIEAIKAFKRTSGRKVVNPDSNSNEKVNTFIRNKLNEKGISFVEFTKKIGIDRSSVGKMFKAGIIRNDILPFLEEIDITKKDLEDLGAIFAVRKNYPRSKPTITVAPETEEEKVVEEEFELVTPETGIIFAPHPATVEIEPEDVSNNDTTSEEELEEVCQDASSDEMSKEVKELVLEQINEFLEFFDKLEEGDQNIILRMINLAHDPSDISMKNIPSECFTGDRFSQYKKIETIVSMIGLS